MNKVLVETVRDHVLACYRQETPPYLHYHNLAHTESVVDHALEIGRAYSLGDEDLTLLSIAAWFHDLGHLYTIPEQHEYKSAALMADFLADRCPPETIERIKNILLATRFMSRPSSLLEEIIRDADTYHLGTPEFRNTDQLVKEEMEERTGQCFGDWEQHALLLLKSHRFHTAYCQEKLNEGKQQNIRYLEERLESQIDQ